MFFCFCFYSVSFPFLHNTKLMPKIQIRHSFNSLWSILILSGESSSVNYWWPSPATVIIGVGPRRDRWPYFYTFQTFTCLKMGPPIRRNEGSNYHSRSSGEWFYWLSFIHSLTHSLIQSLSLQPWLNPLDWL
jgi:hypothetical protein